MELPGWRRSQLCKRPARTEWRRDICQCLALGKVLIGAGFAELAEAVGLGCPLS
jgi:hypothetical protein